MNQRIQELAMQTDIWCDQNVAQGSPAYNNLWEQKFAELIVRECASACLHDDWEDPRWGRFYANKIREHFGVEE